MFDLDNDGQADLVVKSTFCMKGCPSDEFHIFPAGSTVLEQANWQDLSPLLATPDKFERTRREPIPLMPTLQRKQKSSPDAIDRGLHSPPFVLDGIA